MKIGDIREVTKPIKSNIRNAYIDFSKMTPSPVAVVTDGVKVVDSIVTLPELPGIGFEGKADLYAEMKALAS